MASWGPKLGCSPVGRIHCTAQPSQRCRGTKAWYGRGMSRPLTPTEYRLLVQHSPVLVWRAGLD
ncbi:MAG TPA: hypothetical protein VGF76_25220, partial [Polyangiaceae bacterium]